MAPMAMRRTPGNPRGTSLKNLKSIWDRSISLALRDECRFLADMPPHDQSRHLGLRGNALALAMKREYTAPFVFSGNAKAFAELVNEAKTAGLAIKRGGRVCNLSGRHDKAGYNFALRSAYRDVGSRLCIVGFGDGENDIEMLQQADIACVIPRPGAKAMDLPHPPSRVITASQAAPHGWIEAAMKALSTIKVREDTFMGDFSQSGIVATLHNFETKSTAELESDLKLFSGYRPMELILPSLLSEIDGPALGDIVEQISKTDYLQHVIIGLDGADRDGYERAYSFFKNLNMPFSMLWNDGPRLRAIHRELEDAGFDPIEAGKGAMSGAASAIPRRAARLTPSHFTTVIS